MCFYVGYVRKSCTKIIKAALKKPIQTNNIERVAPLGENAMLRIILLFLLKFID
jgi:hypothetical protein